MSQQTPEEPMDLFSLLDEGASDEPEVRSESGTGPATGGGSDAGVAQPGDAGLGGEPGSVEAGGGGSTRGNDSGERSTELVAGGAASTDDPSGGADLAATAAAGEDVDGGPDGSSGANTETNVGPATGGAVLGAGDRAGSGGELSGQPLRWAASTQVGVPSGKKSRARANLDAIAVIRSLEREQRYATADEQAVLAQYSSWGAVPEIFEDREDWAELSGRMQELMTREEIAQAQITTLNAHYTDPEGAATMWRVLQDAGFASGTVLEPGCGSGTFITHAPQGAQMVGVELDSMTAKIASALSPQATIRAEGFERTFLPTGGLSAAIGNVPFGSAGPFDLKDNADNHSLHNYFIHKTMKHMAPGGYGLFITSSWTMDAKSTKSRRAISDHSDLVAAVRLPGGAFQRVAGTQVQTDVLVFRRRDPDTAPNREVQDAWVVPSTEVGDIDGESVSVSTSKFFQDHPDHVMGSTRLGRVGMTQQPALVVEGETGGGLWERVKTSLSRQVEQAGARGLGFNPEPDPDVSVDALAPGGLVVPGDDVEAMYEGQVRVNESGVVQTLAADHTWTDVSARRGASVVEMRALVGLKTQIREVINRQQAGESVSDALVTLNDRYDAYVESYGPINRYKLVAGRAPTAKAIEREVEAKRKKWAASFDDLSASDRAELQPDEEMMEEWRAEASEPDEDVKTQAHLTFLRTDPDYGKVLGLEVFDEAEQTATKSGYFQAETFATGLGDRAASTADDALSISLDESQRVNIERIAELLDTDVDTAREELGQSVFDDPDTGEIVPATQYLSGDVREKLRAAQAAAVSNSDYEVNVEALERVTPEWTPIESVSMQPGVRFVTAEQYRQFAQDTLGVSITFAELPDKSGWSVDTVSKSKLSARVRFEFGTEKANPTWILGRSMNNVPVTITRAEYVDGKEHRVPDQKATALARQKQAALTAAFSEWVQKDPSRKRTIEEQYNNQLNAFVPADYRKLGERLRLPGLAPDRTPHPYQRAAVARIVNEPSVLLNHVVGAGKTGSMVMGAMELRRTGVARKPFMVVPNHLTDQITREFNQWYPAANVLTFPTGADPYTRRRFGAMSAASDWDAVIVPQSTFSKMTVAPSKLRRWLEDDIEQMKADKAAAGNEGAGGRIRAKAIAQAIKQAEKRLERIRDHKDVGLSFEETGCDYLFIDEAHNFKNLRRVSAFRELQCAGSDKATDLDYILRTLREAKAERAGSSTDMPAVATFATGTPVSNSLAEQWVMGHYLRPDLMEHFGVPSIDAFGSTFTKAKDSIEVKPSGAGFRLVNRVSSFSNVEALMRMTSLYESVVTRDQIPGKLPSVAGGKMRPIERDASPHVAEYVAELADEAENPDESKGLLEILGRARKVALDPRMVGLEADEDGGRVRAVADEVMRIEREHSEHEYLDSNGNVSAQRGGLQLLFCDQGTPGGATGFSMYQAIKDELVEQGIAPARVAFIHDAKSDSERADLFSRARRGDLSVLIGSTEKMGTGMNVQDRVTAIHHVDVPWKPSDLEQREGRALRQGNQNESVEITAMVTAGTFDSYMWQKVGAKSAFLDQLRRGTAGHEIEDIGGLTMSSQEMVAVASGDVRVSEWMRLNNQVMELENLRSAEVTAQRSMRHGADAARTRVSWLSEYVDSIRSHEEQVPTGEFRMQLGSRTHTNRATAGRALIGGLRQASVRLRDDQNARFALARMGGLTVVASFETAARGAAVRLSFDGVSGVSDRVYFDDLLDGKVSDTGLATRLWNRAVGLPETRERMETDLAAAQSEVDEMEDIASDATGFSRQDELDKVTMERDFLGAQLGLEAPDSMTGDDGGSEYFSGEEMEKLYAREAIEHTTHLRTGDIVEIARAAEGISAGMYEVRHLDRNGHQVRPEGSTDDADWTPLTYQMAWEFVRRQRKSMTGWEQRVLRTSEADVVLSGIEIVGKRSQIEVGERVSVNGSSTTSMGERASARASEAFTGELLELSISRMEPFARLRTDDGGEVVVDMSGQRHAPVMIRHEVIDSEELARAAAEAEAKAEADRMTLRAGRILPGDILVSRVEGVGERGDVVDATGAGVVNPDTEAKAGKIPFDGFQGEIQEGRNLTDEEIQRAFGGPLDDIDAESIRIGDVVDGQTLDHKRGIAGDVVVTGITGYDPYTFTYRLVNEPRWAGTHEARRRGATKIGSIKARRFGALEHVEKLKLATEADVVKVGALTDATLGSWVSTSWAPQETDAFNREKIIGRLQKIQHDVSMPRTGRSIYGSRESRGTILVLEVDKDTAEANGPEQITVKVESPKYQEVAVLAGGWPTEGVDFRGGVVGESAVPGTGNRHELRSLRGLELTETTELVAEPAVVEDAQPEAVTSPTEVEPDAAATPEAEPEVLPEPEPEAVAVEPDTEDTEAEPAVVEDAQPEAMRYGFRSGRLWVAGLSEEAASGLSSMRLSVDSDGMVEPGENWSHRGYLGSAIAMLETHGAERAGEHEAGEVPRIGDWVAFELPGATAQQAQAVGRVENLSETGMVVGCGLGGRRWLLDVAPYADVEILSADHAGFVAAARAFHKSPNAEERLRTHGYRFAREVEPGDRVTFTAESRAVTTPWPNGDARVEDFEDVLVAESEADPEGLYLLVTDGKDTRVAVCDEETRVKVTHEASALSKSEARVHRQNTAVATSAEVDTDDLQIGTQVRISGTDAVSGGSVDEAQGEVVEVTDSDADAPGSVSVREQNGKVQVVERGTETIEREQRRMVELVDVRDDPGVQQGRGWMRAAQIRRGDQVRMPGAQESHPVYEARKFNGQFMDITAANDENVLVTARLSAGQFLNVERPASTDDLNGQNPMSKVLAREARGVRSGDVMHLDGRRLAVVWEHAGAAEGVLEFQCADLETGEEQLHRAYEHTPVQIQRELATEPRDGVRGAVVPVPARQLRAGMLIHTRSAEPAYVNSAVRSGDQVEVSYQMVGKHKASEQRTLTKRADDPVGVHLPHERPIQRGHTSRTSEDQPPRMQQDFGTSGPDVGLGMG